jgi:UDP-N-acetyl-D-mannosaminuronic acid transferase (WecB/TagA/CpsF family)
MSAGLDRAGFAARDRIVARIASSGADVLAVGAGAGCGKTTLFCRGRGA